MHGLLRPPYAASHQRCITPAPESHVPCATAACVLQGRPGAIAISVLQLLGLVLADIGALQRHAAFAHRLCLHGVPAFIHSSSRVLSRAAAYSITGAIAMQTVADLIGSSFRSEWKLVLIMGAFELVLSQASGCWVVGWRGWRGRAPGRVWGPFALNCMNGGPEVLRSNKMGGSPPPAPCGVHGRQSQARHVPNTPADPKPGEDLVGQRTRHSQLAGLRHNFARPGPGVQ